MTSLICTQSEIRGFMDGTLGAFVRPVKPKPTNDCEWSGWLLSTTGDQKNVGKATWQKQDGSYLRIRSPFGQTGERLALKETWAIKDCGRLVKIEAGEFTLKHRLQYCATDEAPQLDTKGNPYWWNKRSPATMPLWAVRNFATVESVTVEKRDDIWVFVSKVKEEK